MAQRIIGLDLGTSEVKVVKLDGSFRGFTVRSCTTVAVPRDPPDEDERPLVTRLHEALDTLAKQDPELFKADAIHTAIPGSLVSTHTITLPFTDTRRIEQTLPFQLEDQIPFELHEIVFDYQELKRENGHTELMVGVVRRETMADLFEVLSKVGIDPRVVSLSSVAYQNLFAHGVMMPLSSITPSGTSAQPELQGDSSDGDELSVAEAEANGGAKEPHTATEEEVEAILDVGHSSTDLCILKNGLVRYARSFTVGGKGLTAAIAAGEGVTSGDAEQLKFEVKSLAAGGTERSRRIAAAVERGIAPLIRGLRQSLFAFRSRTRLRVSRLYLTGGTALLPDLDEHLASELGCEVMLLDPFPNHLEINLPEEQVAAPTCGLALALALRGQGGTRTARMNLRKGEFAYKGDLSHLKGTFPRLAVLGVLVLVLLGANVLVRFHALSTEESRLDAQLCEITERVLGTCTTIPDDAISRLRGQQATASLVPRVSAADILSEVVRRLSQLDEMEIRELDIGGSRVRLQGDAESFDAVARVVSTLRGYECFEEVSQGQTRQARQSGKIEFNVDAVLTAQCEN